MRPTPDDSDGRTVPAGRKMLPRVTELPRARPHLSEHSSRLRASSTRSDDGVPAGFDPRTDSL